MSAWFFTAPWEPVAIRRGDALGFRAAADYFAELLAPGLSNGTSDARWISLLSWSLKWSHVAWRKSGGTSVATREEQRRRYAWLRPLELLWVARALATGQQTGQLRGRRRVSRWLGSARSTQRLPNFAMSADQFRRYRQAGSYGAYRVLFRSIPGLSSDDGWTPGDTALELASLVNASLPTDARLDDARFERGTKWGSWSEQEARYWERVWPAWELEPGGFLPTSESEARTMLPLRERTKLREALFDERSVRTAVATTLARATSARSHLELCESLAGSRAVTQLVPPGSLDSLPGFSDLADSAMQAMRSLWRAINQDAAHESPPLARVARNPELQSALQSVRTAAEGWLRAPGRTVFPYDHAVTGFAHEMTRAGSSVEQLRAIAKHHGDQGGGRRWFRAQGENLSPLVPDTGVVSSDYRFRLNALCRLAAQCGVAPMDGALDALARQPDFAEDEEES